jgi:hypothetical protein
MRGNTHTQRTRIITLALCIHKLFFLRHDDGDDDKESKTPFVFQLEQNLNFF